MENKKMTKKETLVAGVIIYGWLGLSLLIIFAWAIVAAAIIFSHLIGAW